MGMLVFAEQIGMEAQWSDVLELIRARTNAMNKELPAPAKGWKLLKDRPTYGPPLMPAALAHGPVNEAGVVYLFGMVAGDLGFVVTRIQSEFPDCEAMRHVEGDIWQKVRIEFEYESRNFVTHLHRVEECDVIVCWKHNWPNCPLDVVELKSVVKGGDCRWSS